MATRHRWFWNGFLTVIGMSILMVDLVSAEEPQDPIAQTVKKLMESRQAADGSDGSDPAGGRSVTDDPEPNPAAQPIDVSAAEVSVSESGTVTLNIVDLPLNTVLRVLSLETNRNIIATPSVQGTVNASLHNVTFEDALDAILAMNQASFRAQGNFIYVYTQDELAEIIASENPPISRVFRLNYARAVDIEPAISSLLSPVGTLSASAESETGIGTDSDNAGAMSLATTDYIVVHDRQENIDRIAQVIRELDIRPRQVLIETTILSAELSDDNALGIDFAAVGGVDLELLGSTSVAVQDINIGALPTDRFEQFNANISTDLTGNVPNGGLSIGVIKDHVAVFVRALEQITDTTVIANPKVLALNKQKGSVVVGRRDGYITTTVTETQAIQTVEFLVTGTQLRFRPFIGNDGFVRMELHPEDSTGGLNAANLPFEQTTEVTTNVIVQDGQTILIGGLFRETDSDTRSQLPGLGDIPGVGELFKSRSDSMTRQEVIVLLTVKIVKDFDAYARQSWEQAEDIERLRVGIREGQMWHGRERLAQNAYKTALECFAAGDYDDSLWHVRMALHHSPRMLSAIKLQEELRGLRDWDDDGTATRSFIHDAIMRDRGVQVPMFDRPAPPFIRPEALPDSDQYEPADNQMEEMVMEATYE
ncbi:MAG: hypothetical protein DHS20C16_30050 [Phycisphaerae bacterium]|nr:MAG: hypothetical protein DHS20C16_30050 [Phycisphaerae bacterium]